MTKKNDEIVEFEGKYINFGGGGTVITGIARTPFNFEPSPPRWDRCKYCRSRVKDEDDRCPHCGAPIDA